MPQGSKKEAHFSDPGHRISFTWVDIRHLAPLCYGMYFKTTRILQKWLQTLFILLHLVLVLNIRLKSIWTHSGGRGAISNTRSFYGACFVSNSVKIRRGPLAPLVPPALPFFQRSILPKTADSINVNKLMKKTKPKWKVQTISKSTKILPKSTPKKKELWLQSKGQPHPHLLPIQHYYVPILIVWIKYVHFLVLLFSLLLCRRRVSWFCIFCFFTS